MADELVAEAITGIISDSLGYAPDGDHLAAFFDADRALKDAVGQLIADELLSRVPEYEAWLDAAAVNVEAAWNARQGPEGIAAGLDADIARGEAQHAEWTAKLASPDISERVNARAYALSWETELGLLREKRQQAQLDLLPYAGAHREAKEELARATAETETLRANVAVPFLGLGQRTFAYHVFRQQLGGVAAVLLGDPGAGEFDAAMGFMDELCLSSGYRTDHLLRDSDLSRALWREVELRASDPPVPSGREIMGVDAARAVDVARSPARV